MTKELLVCPEGQQRNNDGTCNPEEEIQVFGKTLRSYARQKCLEEGAFQKDEEEKCINDTIKTEKSLIRRERATMRNQAKSIKKIFSKDPEKINLDYLDSIIDGIGVIASGHVLKYNDRASGNIQGLCTHLTGLSSEWRHRNKSKMPVEEFKRDADTLVDLLDSYLEI